ncbi:hypothetical protein [Arthrobacter sp. H16F315]|uniref:hypothetical protein n=1 Tax=Arthrobacter sp. H16F315 TaxID=2955314 RepID=UPI003159442D
MGTKRASTTAGAAVASEEILGGGQVRCLKDPGIVLEPPAAEGASDHVANLVAGDGSGRDNADQHRQRQLQLLVQEAGREQQ